MGEASQAREAGAVMTEQEPAAGKPAVNLSGAMTEQEARCEATEALAAQADRFTRAAQVLMRMVIRLSTLDDPAKLFPSIVKYQHSALPEPEVVEDVATMLEGTKSAEWRRQGPSSGKPRCVEGWRASLPATEQPITDLPDWGAAMLVRMAREKCDLLRSAADAIERGQDVDDILHHLTNYMSGRYGIWALQHALKSASVAVGQSNVVPLFGGGKDAR